MFRVRSRHVVRLGGRALPAPALGSGRHAAENYRALSGAFLMRPLPEPESVMGVMSLSELNWSWADPRRAPTPPGLASRIRRAACPGTATVPPTPFVGVDAWHSI